MANYSLITSYVERTAKGPSNSGWPVRNAKNLLSTSTMRSIFGIRRWAIKSLYKQLSNTHLTKRRLSISSEIGGKIGTSGPTMLANIHLFYCKCPAQIPWNHGTTLSKLSLKARAVYLDLALMGAHFTCLRSVISGSAAITILQPNGDLFRLLSVKDILYWPNSLALCRNSSYSN